MAKAEEFYLDTGGGALILQQTAKAMVHGSAQRIARAAMAMSGSSSGRKASLKVVGSISNLKGKANSARYTATIIAADSESEIQMRKGNYVAKARNAGRV